jgi:tol-pal system-associated acyl-CoA thioesterase
MSVPQEGRLQVKVYYEDTDALGIVYYANYLKYFERGRTELFEQTGRSVAEWNADGYNVAVFKANVTYHAPARLGDECEVVTRRMVTKTLYRLTCKQELWRGEELLTEAEIQLVCLDKDLELQEFPEDWVANGAAWS